MKNNFQSSLFSIIQVPLKAQTLYSRKILQEAEEKKNGDEDGKYKEKKEKKHASYDYFSQVNWVFLCTYEYRRLYYTRTRGSNCKGCRAGGNNANV